MTDNLWAKLKKRSDSEPDRAAALGIPAGGVARMISSSGRIGLPVLQQVARSLSRVDFVQFMQQPVLAGAAIHLGTLSTRSGAGSRTLNRTILFEPLESSAEPVSASESLKQAIYPLVRGEFATSAGAMFSIGRIDGNDLIMPDYAISRNHAILEIKRGDYFLKDCGSTNGTTLKSARLQNKPVQLHDRDVISFARYEFTFLFPGSLYDMLMAA
ncbi:MAG: FHA domain-containing protein [Deltaproteobacteria bacterium]|nr:FHA domain-containing protein [Deltaproteobacteria bacterium]